MNSHDCREGLTAFGWMALLVLTVLTVALWGPEWLGTHIVKQPEDWSSKRVVFEDGHIIMVPPSANWTELVAAPGGLWIQRGSNTFYLLTTNIVWKGNQ